MFGEVAACPAYPDAFSTGVFDRPIDSQNKCERYLLYKMAADDCRSGHKTTPEQMAAAVASCVRTEQSEKTTYRLAAVGIAAASVLAYFLLRK